MGSSPSDHCLPGSEDSTLDSNEPACKLCGFASRTSSANASLLSTGPEFRAIPTCAPLWPTPDASVAQLGEMAETWLPRMEILKAKHGNGNGHGMPLTMAAQLGPTWRIEQGLSCPCRCHTSMSSAAASLARISLTLARAPDSTGHARVFGQSTPVSLASFDPDTSSWRTSQLSLLGGSEPFSETWPRSGMTRSGTAYQLAPLAPLTGGTAPGSWPTPTAMDATSGSVGHQLALSMLAKSGALAAGNTADQAVAEHTRLPAENGTRHSTWPTRHGICQPEPRRPEPSGNEFGRAVNKAETWATPTAWLGCRPNRAVGKAERFSNPERSNELSDQIAARGTSGSLNPTWVEWLMGFPIGWTDLEALGTP
jgi:hypothetical protein